jgi:hypothetical protein
MHHNKNLAKNILEFQLGLQKTKIAETNSKGRPPHAAGSHQAGSHQSLWNIESVHECEYEGIGRRHDI